jgi:tetratricopeptide (TPR) repeat protein
MFIKRKEDDINAILKRAKKFEEKNKLDDAIVEVQRAIQLNGKDGNLYNQLGDLYIRTGSTDEAVHAYRKGVKAYRRETFPRNALALCKKIARCDPYDIDVYYDMGDLSLELDEKSEAMIYFFKYIDKRKNELNIDEVVRTLEHIEETGITDIDVQKRIYETYVAVGRDDQAQKYLPSMRKAGVTVAPGTTHVAARPTVEKVSKPKKGKGQSTSAQTRTADQPKQNSAAQLDAMVKRLEAVVAQLQETVRLDQIAATLKNGIEGLSQTHDKASGEQKRTISLLQKSFALNIDTLQKSIKKNTEALQKSIDSFNDGSAKDRKKHVALLTNLKVQLENMSKTQDSVVEHLGEKLESAGAQFTNASKIVINEVKKVLSGQKEANETVAQEIEKILSAHEQATEHVCFKLDEHKECNSSLAENAEEMKARIQEISQCFMDFVAAQKCMQTKQRHFAKMVLIGTGVIAALLALSIFV